MKEIADHQANTGAGGGRATGVPVSWLTIDDPLPPGPHYATSSAGSARVYIHYPVAADSLGECWPGTPP